MVTFPTLKKLQLDVINYLKINGTPTEFDMSINDISRDIIIAMNKEKEECWLGKINLNDDKDKPFTLTKYIPGKTELYNFEYDFCLPVYDLVIEQMINDRDKAQYNDKKDWERICAITDRMESLNGISLLWA